MTAIVTNVSSASPGGTLPGEAHEKQLQAEVRCRVPEHSIREYTVPKKSNYEGYEFQCSYAPSSTDFGVTGFLKA